MPHAVTCPGCGKRLGAGPEHAGRPVRCGHCRLAFTAPGDVYSLAPASPEARYRPGIQPPKSVPPAPRRGRPGPRPHAAGIEWQRSTLIAVAALAVGLLVLCLAGGLVVFLVGGEPAGGTSTLGTTTLDDRTYRDIQRAFASDPKAAAEKYLGRRYAFSGKVIHVWPGRREAAVLLDGTNGLVVGVTLWSERSVGASFLQEDHRYSFVGRLESFQVGGPLKAAGGPETAIEACFEDATAH